jgi:hypothetical protein
MFKVQELYDFFVSARRANCWPYVCVTLDEAVKKSRADVYLNST